MFAKFLAGPMLFQAIQDNDAEEVKWLLEKKVDLSSCGTQGWSSLHQAVFAAKNDDPRIVLLLIAHEAKPEVKTTCARDGIPKGTMPHEMAFQLNKLQIASILHLELAKESLQSLNAETAYQRPEVSEDSQCHFDSMVNELQASHEHQAAKKVSQQRKR